MELLLTGRWFTGQEAADMGLVSKAVPVAEVLPVALEMARDIAANTAPVAVGVTKQLVYKNLMETDRVAAFTEETKLTWWAGSQPDTMEGVTALMTKRTPQWTQSKHLPIPDDLPEHVTPDAASRLRRWGPYGLAPVLVLVAAAFIDGMESNFIPGVLVTPPEGVPLRRHSRGSDPRRDGDRGADRHLPAGYLADRTNRIATSGHRRRVVVGVHAGVRARHHLPDVLRRSA